MKVVLQRSLAAVAMLVGTSARSANSLQETSNMMARMVHSHQATAVDYYLVPAP